MLRSGADGGAPRPLHGDLRGRLRRWPRSLIDRVAWTRPTRAEVASVARAALAAALAWLLAVAVTDIDTPVLASIAAVITVRVSVHSSVRSAIERSAAVVLGVLGAVALGGAVGLSVVSVALLTCASLIVAQLLLRLPRQAATQVPVSLLVVMAAGAAGEEGYAWVRAVETVLGAAVGVGVSLALPASRVAEAREALPRLGDAVGLLLDDMSHALTEIWSTDQTAMWRRRARITRQGFVGEATEAIGNSREAAQWNVRDRGHVAELELYESVLPRFERTAIGVWALARGLDDHAELAGGGHRPMRSMGALLGSLGDLVRAFTDEVLGQGQDRDMQLALNEVAARRELCAQAVERQTLLALGVSESDQPPRPSLEWMSYTALLVQIDRIVEDLSTPLPG